MNTKSKSLFVRLWLKEISLNNQIQLLDTSLNVPRFHTGDRAEIETQIATFRQRIKSIDDKIIFHIQNGNFPENAVDICKDELGATAGYVADCYSSLYSDYAPSGSP